MTEFGPVEAKYREWVAGLGELSARQAAAAAQLYRTAALLDTEEGGSAASALSRELRRQVIDLRDEKLGPSVAPSGTVDRVAQQRAKRRDGRRGVEPGHAGGP